MENCKATNKPDSYEAVHYEKIRWDVMRHSIPKTAFLLKNVGQRKCKHINAQDGWSWYEHEEEPIVTLQAD